MKLEIQFIAFLATAVLVAYGASRLRLPYTIAMVLAGLGVSLLNLDVGGLQAFHLDSELILIVFLPGLLFEAAYHIDLREFRSNLKLILLLAIPGVALSTLIIGFLLNLGLGLGLAEALVFGVLISATDPIAVTALFKELGVDKRLGTIIEGESLFNDGVSIVLFGILVSIATGEGVFHLGDSLITFFVTVAGGAVLGLAAGFLFSELMKHTNEPLLDLALTTILAYGTYLLAEEGLHGAVSPVIAVVVAAIVVGNYGSSGRHSPTSTTMIVTFWEFVVFLINSAVFLLIGMEVEPAALIAEIGPIALTIVAVLIVRAIVVYLLRFLSNAIRLERLPLEWAHVMLWGGLRGAVSVALALSLPASLASRELLLDLTFGYVLFSLIVQGIGIRPLLDRLGLTRGSDREREFEEHLAHMAAAHASIVTIQRLHEEHILPRTVAERLRKDYEARIVEYQRELDQLLASDPTLASTNVRLVQREVAYTQKQTLRNLLRRGLISEEVYASCARRIDERLQKDVVEDWILSTELVESMENYLRQETTPGLPAADKPGSTPR
ncbi:MAG TPA: Na+/H+ antiporter [Chloroflexi bacterium]|nr:Na+/H+ antiporter [Chloroflexota bacterium]